MCGTLIRDYIPAKRPMSFASWGPSGHRKVCGRQKAADLSVMPIAEGASGALGSHPAIKEKLTWQVGWFVA